MHTNIKERIVTDIVDIHEKGISTHLNVCIHKYKYSYNCMYTQRKVEIFLNKYDILCNVEKVLKNAIQW